MPMDRTQRGDEIAERMRDYYEANKPLHWWQKRRVWRTECADELMIGLLNVAMAALEEIP